MAHNWTYETLKFAIQDYAEDDNNEFVAQLDTFIGLGELKLLRDLEFETFDAVEDGQFTVGDAVMTKPDGTLSPTSIHYVGHDGEDVYLEQRHYDWVKAYTRGSSDMGLPRYFAEVNETTWQVAPLPESDFVWQARVIKRPDGLSDTNATTWLGTNMPEALLYGCLIHAEEYLKADERAAYWRGRYNEEVVPMARKELRNLLRSEYSPQTSVEGRR